jgi:CRP-like cAMP-binding protein/uncharacterized protein YozE (UPF0346 family)
MGESSTSVLRHWLLAGVPADDLGMVVSTAREVRFLPGDVIFREGDEPDGLYLVTGGAARVTASDDRGGTLYATVGADDLLGEMGVLDGQPRSATATAAKLCTAYFVPAESFLDTLERSPGLCGRLLAFMAVRLRQVDGRLADLPGVERPITGPRRDSPVVHAGLPQQVMLVPPQRPGEPGKPYKPPQDSYFYQWLMARTHWGDTVGDAARYVRDDPEWPREVDDVETLVRHMEAVHADEVLQAALRRAWRAWRLTERRSGPSGTLPHFE